MKLYSFKLLVSLCLSCLFEYVYGDPPTSVAEISRVLYHDSQCFTQGLIFYNGNIYESCGQYGLSSLRIVNPQTGVVLKYANIPIKYFAEGIEVYNGEIFLLTWREKRCIVFDALTLKYKRIIPYEGEGWGICLLKDGVKNIQTGPVFAMSDGSNFIFFRDPATFALIGKVEVKGFRNLNELECVNGYIYSNVWYTDDILVIHPENGTVVNRISDIKPLTQQQKIQADVLNGIAYNPHNKMFYFTGKFWPTMYTAKFYTPKEK